MLKNFSLAKLKKKKSIAGDNSTILEESESSLDQARKGSLK